MGAGTFHTIDNDKFVFNEPGVYTLLYIPKTVNNPEVRIQIRLERYPNRRVDFSTTNCGWEWGDKMNMFPPPQKRHARPLPVPGTVGAADQRHCNHR